MHLIHDLKDEMKARGDLGMQLDALKKQAGVTRQQTRPRPMRSLKKPPKPLKKQIAELQAKLDEMPPLVGWPHQGRDAVVVYHLWGLPRGLPSLH
jgi:hypothetical protein